MKRIRIATFIAALGLLCGPSLGQDQPSTGERTPPPRAPGDRGGAGVLPRQRLTPEKAKAAWEIQAQGVAQALALSDDQAKQIVAAYSEARQSHDTAVEKIRNEITAKARDGEGSGDDGTGAIPDPQARRNVFNEMQTKLAELTKADREKLQATLSATLDAEQVNKAIASLGTFNPNWDVMVDLMSGFNLEQAKSAQALAAIEQYVIAVGAIQGGSDREASRTAMREARAHMLDAIKPLLNDEEFHQFERASIGGRGARARGGEGGVPGERGRGGEGASGERGGGEGGGRGGAGGRGGSGAGGAGGEGGEDDRGQPSGEPR